MADRHSTEAAGCGSLRALAKSSLVIGALSLMWCGPAIGSVASDCVGTWFGDHASLISAPSPTSLPQSQADLEAQSHTLVITADTIELRTAAGAATHSYTVLEETETTLTLQTALGSSSGTTERPLLITWIDADTIQLRLGNAPYEIVFTRAP